MTVRTCIFLRLILFYPNIATNLTPYVSTQVARILIKQVQGQSHMLFNSLILIISWWQPPKVDYKGKYKQRATAMKIVGEYVSNYQHAFLSDGMVFLVSLQIIHILCILSDPEKSLAMSR